MDVLSFFRFRREKRAQRLYEEARELIDVHAYEKALKIARKLRKLRYTGAFEIEALAYSGLDRGEDAVRVLREGLERAPGVWRNWILLGSCLSDRERYDEALLAYDRAEACEQADPAVIDLNRAIVALRRDDPETALRCLDRIYALEGPTMRYSAIDARMSALRGLGRGAEALDLGTRTLNAWRDAESSAAQNQIGRIAVQVCEMRLATDENRHAVRVFATSWWRATHAKGLLWVFRELNPPASPRSQYFRIVVEGTIAPESPLREIGRGFAISADAVADSDEEALAFVAELAAEPGVELAIDEAKAVEARTEGPKGVYFLSGRVFYETE